MSRILAPNVPLQQVTSESQECDACSDEAPDGSNFFILSPRKTDKRKDKADNQRDDQYHYLSNTVIILLLFSTFGTGLFFGILFWGTLMALISH
jgi:hypothetical protein